MGTSVWLCLIFVLPHGGHTVNIVPILVSGISGPSFAVIIAGGFGETGVIIRINADFRPIFCRAAIVHSCQATATGERRIADSRDTIRNRNARQATATLERIIADACDAIRYRNTC